MTDKNTTGKDKPAPTGEHILEVITAAFDSPEVEYHKLFLFDRLTMGEKNWHFLIVTRQARDGRLELAAFSYELGPQGNLQTKLESRKARIPAERLSEVIDGLLIRLDQFDSSLSMQNIFIFRPHGRPEECDLREPSILGNAPRAKRP